MATARDLINGSLRLLGVVAAGESASAAEHNDALNSLNSMLDSWANERNALYLETRETFTLTGGKADYTIGTGGDFSTLRPVEFLSARIYDQNTNIRTRLEILNTPQWDSQQVKNLSTELPTRLYCNFGNPLATITLWPIPNVAKQIELTTLKPFTKFTSVNATVDLPPGYERALRYNLAIELAPEYGKSATPEVAMAAEESKANIKKTNAPDIFMTTDAPAMSNGGRRFNLLTGE